MVYCVVILEPVYHPTYNLMYNLQCNEVRGVPARWRAASCGSSNPCHTPKSMPLVYDRELR